MNRLRLPIIKGLITLVILAIFFYLGRELVELYRVPAATNLLREFDSSRASPISVRFGEAPGTFLQQEINGNKQAACIALERACYELAEKSPLPTSKPSDAETALLNAHLPISSDSKPKEDIRVLHIDSQGLIVFAIRHDADGRHHTQTDPGINGRVVCWGFATPIQSDRWNIRVVSRTGNSTENGVASINIPPGSTKILQIASPEGPEILAFKNDLELSEQIDHFNRILSANRWEAMRSWQSGPNHSMATFVREDELTKQIAKIHIRRKKTQPSGSNFDAWWGIINLTNYNKDTPFIHK